MTTLSPLRYPGGKASFTDFFGRLLEVNGLEGGLYAEPFAGGAGAAAGLLVAGYVDRIAINDADRRVYAFWKSALRNTTRFIRRVEATPLTIEEWERQRAIYLRPEGKSDLAVGFASFFLNRANRSGIMVNGGPIGGKAQTGKWKLDARFNKLDLIARIERLADYGDRILLSCEDAADFLQRIPAMAGTDPALVYLDPPYFEKGGRLYMNAFTPGDHERLGALMENVDLHWVMTYDDCPEIRRIYQWANCRSFSLKYSAYKVRSGGEVLIWPDSIRIPKLGGSAKIRR
ncbi:DNA adenine methylase [Haloferula sargassicola]|uniref:Site-specific DNA-methyltransferase (adenine-specific) n=1 Tax=Haloferula sargassicola TaxID=490096 RepID=A0ABP9UKM7_9BACT